MHLKLLVTTVFASLIAGVAAQDVTKLCTVSPSGCTIGATACPTGCIKSARCQSPCPAQKTTVVTYTAHTTVKSTITSISTMTSTTTKTVTASPTTKPATCAKQVPYINLFTFKEQACSTLVDADFDLLCLVDDPQVNYTFSGPPNKLNSPTLKTTPDGHDYSQGRCVELAVQDSYSAFFTIDGTAGTNALTTADCHITLFAKSGCTGVTDSYNVNKANTCQVLALEDDPWKSAYLECSNKLVVM